MKLNYKNTTNLILVADNLYIQFNIQKKRTFIPNVPIDIHVKADRKSESIFFRNMPYNYTIELIHGDYKWEIIRTYKDFKDAHKALAKEAKEKLGYSDISP